MTTPATTTRPLNQIPLDELVPVAMERLRSASLDELGAMLSGRRSVVLTVEQIAELIVAMPGPSSKLAAIENALVLRAMDSAGGNMSAASRLLQVNRKTLIRKVSRARRTGPGSAPPPRAPSSERPARKSVR